MNLIRKYKIYKFNGKADDKSKEIFDFVDSKLLNLNRFEDIKWKDVIFYFNLKHECVLLCEFEGDILYLVDKAFFIFYENKYRLEKNDDIDKFIKYRINKILNLKIDYISHNIFEIHEIILKTYKKNYENR